MIGSLPAGLPQLEPQKVIIIATIIAIIIAAAIAIMIYTIIARIAMIAGISMTITSIDITVVTICCLLDCPSLSRKRQS